MKNPQKFLKDMRVEMGYDTCRQTKEYDAKKCQRNCKKLAKSKFAKDCEKNDGLFKCCIRFLCMQFCNSVLHIKPGKWKRCKNYLLNSFFRRDKVFCHECRFCCTLSVCTYKNGTTTFKPLKAAASKQSGKDTVHVERRQQITAASAFQMPFMKLFKAPDYRCLKPIRGKASIKWPHYNMSSYQNAKTKDELKKVEVIPFDKYFFNLEDPEVFKEMTDSKKGQELWKKTYGFDFVAFMWGYQGGGNMTACRKHCLEAEYGEFAKKCKEEGGFFKCCMLG